MTVAAGRQFLLGIVHLETVDTALEDFCDSQVAIATGICDVLGTHRGRGIVSRKFAVRRMTVNACGCYQQTTLEKSLPMNAHGVVFQNLGLLTPIGYGRFLPFAMTPAAEIRYVFRERRRIQILFSLRIVRPVAVCAIRGIRVSIRATSVILRSISRPALYSKY